jgi:hypothetical protein
MGAMKAFVTVLVLFLMGCADEPDHSEPFARFTSRPVLLQASSDLRDACFESIDQSIAFFRESGVTMAITVVDPGAPSVNGIPVRGVIGIYPGVPQHLQALAETKRAFTIGGDILAADIVLREANPYSCEALAIAHELGHALGLVNTDDAGNLMNGTFGLGGWSLTEAQLEWISD